MKPINSRPQTTDPLVLQAWEILQSSDRSAEALTRLQSLHQQAQGDAQVAIGKYLEAFVVSQ